MSVYKRRSSIALVVKLAIHFYEMATVNIKVYENVGSAYLQRYRDQQRGAGNIVFRGPRRWQRGDGFGDILRGIARFMLPVVVKGATAFAGEALDASERGASLGEAAKGALKPALQAAVQAVAENFQGGVGNPEATLSSKPKAPRSKPKATRSKTKRKSKSKSKSGNVKQKGAGRRKTSAKRVYKGARGGIQIGGSEGKKRTGKAAGRKRKTSKRTKLSTANSNF